MEITVEVLQEAIARYCEKYHTQVVDLKEIAKELGDPSLTLPKIFEVIGKSTNPLNLGSTLPPFIIGDVMIDLPLYSILRSPVRDGGFPHRIMRLTYEEAKKIRKQRREMNTCSD